MGRDLAENHPAARRVFEEADDVLAFALSDIMWNGPEADLNDTVNTQPALYVHSLAAHAALRESLTDFEPAAMAGHSLGELSALAAAGALSFRAGLQLVRRRGELMKRAGEERPGGMAAILNLDLPALEKICAEASTKDEPVQVANDNCPGQVVISGAKPAVERAMQAAKAAGARRATPLVVSIAAHSQLMASIQEEWDQAVAAAGVADSNVGIIGNVNASLLRSGRDLVRDIELQMQSRVRWTESMQQAARLGINAFLEVGTGSVLLGLIRRILPDATGMPLGTAADFDALKT
jgi:[acyl-carrier-protein] S-malonyltransferase